MSALIQHLIIFFRSNSLRVILAIIEDIITTGLPPKTDISIPTLNLATKSATNI